jgi:hypothetical protein
MLIGSFPILPLVGTPIKALFAMTMGLEKIGADMPGVEIAGTGNRDGEVNTLSLEEDQFPPDAIVPFCALKCPCHSAVDLARAAHALRAQTRR